MECLLSDLVPLSLAIFIMKETACAMFYLRGWKLCQNKKIVGAGDSSERSVDNTSSTSTMTKCSCFAGKKKMRLTESLGLTPLNLLIDAIIWIIVATPIGLMYYFIRPTNKGFFCDDKSLSYPYREDTIPPIYMYLATCLTPLVLITATEWINWQFLDKTIGNGTQYSTTIRAYTIFLFGITLNQFFVDIPKYFVPELRPNFLDVCRPNYTICEGYMTDYECTNKAMSKNDIIDTMRSFPSGHAAICMFSALYTVLYLELRFDIKISRFLKPSMQMALLIVSAWAGMTRVSDHKHHLQDVIVGGAIGVMVASGVFYKITCPSLRQQQVKTPPPFNNIGEPQTPTPLILKPRC